MINQVLLVGRLVNDVKTTTINDNTIGFITLAIPRSYKNEDGVYETDFVKCKLCNNMVINTAEYCKKGDLVGVKGRLSTKNFEDKTEILYVSTDKITFLSSKKEENIEEKEE